MGKGEHRGGIDMAKLKTVPLVGRKRNPRNVKGSTHIRVIIPIEYYDLLDKEADRQDRSLGFVVRQCIAERYPELKGE